MKKKNERTRNWLFIMYPESMPENAFEILEKEQVPLMISPLHHGYEKNMQEERKDHYHIGLFFSGVKSFDQVLEITQKVNGTRPIPMNDPVGSARYFIHLDNPEKEQFGSPEEAKQKIITMGGLDLTGIFEINFSEKLAYLKKLMQIIDDNNITEFDDLESLMRDNIDTNFYVVLTCSHTIAIQAKLKSKRHKTNHS